MKIFFYTFGCRVNQVETESLREALLSSPGNTATPDPEKADVCVLNTCTVTENADKDARRLLRRIHKRNPRSRAIVTGCLATRDPKALARAHPAVEVVDNRGKAGLPAILGCPEAALGFGVSALYDHSRAFVKVQDGCRQGCAYCVVPSVRSELWSKPVEAAASEVRDLVIAGYQEIVLCGIRLGLYRSERPNGAPADLTALLVRLLEVPGRFRLRLSSLEITELTDRLIDCVRDSGGRLCPSFHLPLQSGSDAVLRRMNRWYTADSYRRRIGSLRSRIPDAGIFADVMTGYPGETDAEFEETESFIKAMGFSGLHVFRYSPRPGTPAASMPAPVGERASKTRAEVLRCLDGALRLSFAKNAVGTRRRVLIEGNGEGLTPPPAHPPWADDDLVGPLGRGQVVGLTDHFLKVRVEGSDDVKGLCWAEIDGSEGPAARARLLHGLPVFS